MPLPAGPRVPGRHRASAGGQGAGSVGRGRAERFPLPLIAAGMLGAALLAVAEFAPLLHVHTSARTAALATVTAGSHHSYALAPVAALAALLMAAGRTPHGRVVLLCLGVLGLVSLGIALLGDLPDARAAGLVHNATGGLSTARSTPAVGLYLETLGGVVLLLTAAAGVLLVPRPDDESLHRNSPVER